MKRFPIAILTLITIICFTQCEKDAFDYRNPYVCDWKFDVNQTEFNTDSVGYYSSESYTYDGEIKYGKSKTTILVKYGIDAEMEIEMNEDGELFMNNPHSSAAFEGYEKLDIYSYNGGLGGGVSLKIVGSRK